MSIGFLPSQLAQRCWPNLWTRFHHASHCCVQHITTKQISVLILLSKLSPGIAVPDAICTLSGDTTTCFGCACLQTQPHTLPLYRRWRPQRQSHPRTATTRGTLSVSSFLFTTAPRTVVPPICPSPPGRTAGTCFRYDHWLVKRSLEDLLLIGWSSGGSLSLPHFSRLHADVVHLFLIAVCQCFCAWDPMVVVVVSTHLKETVRAS